MLAALLLACSAVAAQDIGAPPPVRSPDDARPSSRPEFQTPGPGEQHLPEAADPGLPAYRSLPDTMAPPPGYGAGTSEDSAAGALPGALSIRSQFEAAMTSVDSLLDDLQPAVAVTVIDLKRIALSRLPSDPRAEAQLRRLLEMRARQLVTEHNRLLAADRALDRWRTGVRANSPITTAISSGVRQRTIKLALLRRQIDCGVYFARAADRAFRAAGESRRPVVPPGC